MSDPVEMARQWAARRHTRVAAFAVCRSTAGRRYRVEAEYAGFEQAREAAWRLKHDQRMVICALTPEGWALQIEQVDG
jgi:hypothetical protein